MLTVGAILQEPLETTLLFVSWYLDQGASKIILCFDDPQDPAIDVLEGHPKVVCHPCTRKFWRNAHAHPTWRFTRRQNLAMQWIYEGLEKGWFLNVDGDELVHLEGRTLDQELALQPIAVRAVSILPVEHVQAPDVQKGRERGKAQFRMAMPSWCRRAIYGDLARVFQARQGLTGHTEGKSVTRVGLTGYSMRQHFMQTLEGVPLNDCVLGPEEGAYLLHFVDQSYDTWRSKLEWRLRSTGFRARLKTIIRDILDGDDPEPQLRELHRLLYVFDKDRLAQLDRARARYEMALDTDAMIARHFAHPSEIQKAIA